MNERIKVRADELQPGDVIVPAPGLYGAGTVIKRAEAQVRVTYAEHEDGRSFSGSYAPDAIFLVDREVPTVTVTLPKELVDRVLSSVGSNRLACELADAVVAAVLA